MHKNKMKAKTLDFKSANAYNPLSYLEVVREQLKQDSLYKPGLLFRGFDARDVERLLREGQDTPGELFCVSESELEAALKTADRITDAFSYAADHDRPALVVYDGSMMIRETKFVYRLSEVNKVKPIVAVYRLKNFLKTKKSKRAEVRSEKGRIALRNIKDEYGIECRRRIKADRLRARETRQGYFSFMEKNYPTP